MVLQKPLAAAILAGGGARRMGGADKGALDVGGQPILARQLDVLRQVAGEIFAVGRAPAGLPPDIRVVPDRIPGAGALGGIYTAIVESPCDRTLVVACDMPFVTRQLVERLVERLAAEDADVIMPRTAQGYEPLCAIYSKACAEGIRERIEHGDLQAAVPPSGVRMVELGPDVLAALDPSGSALTNVNTPADHQRAIRLADRTGERAGGKG
jgi:molybdenum cofactor guanylyltransferase